MITELDEKKRTATVQPPKKPAPSAPSHSAWDDEVPETSALKKWSVPLIAGTLLTVGIGFVAKSLSKKSDAPPPKQETMIVRLEVPKPTPPPVQPPPPPPQAEEKKVEMVEEVKQENAPPEPTPQVETALKGAGNSGIVLKSGSGSGIFANRNTVSAERLRWSAYAGRVRSRLVQALESHPKTRTAEMSIVVKVWLDETGRITRARLDGATADSGRDAAIRDEILVGLQIAEPPPPGMPMPINMRVTARKRS
jgi:outer membrane biosynthesis protein TonB